MYGADYKTTAPTLFATACFVWNGVCKLQLSCKWLWPMRMNVVTSHTTTMAVIVIPEGTAATIYDQVLRVHSTSTKYEYPVRLHSTWRQIQAVPGRTCLGAQHTLLAQRRRFCELCHVIVLFQLVMKTRNIRQKSGRAVPSNHFIKHQAATN